MKKLSSLDVGDKFRPAHPAQKSMNNLQMFCSCTYIVEKVYVQSPFFYICRTHSVNDGRIYSLSPNTPVIGSREPAPSIAQIEKFMNAPKSRKRAVAYRLLWDGVESFPKNLLERRKNLLRLMKAHGKKEYLTSEIEEFAIKDHAGFFAQRNLIRGFNSRDADVLVAEGLIEKIFDDEKIPQEYREINVLEAPK